MTEKEAIIKGLLGLISEPTYQDSLEIGTPGKGGAVKIYCNFSNIEETNTRIKNALDSRDYARGEIATRAGGV